MLAGKDSNVNKRFFKNLELLTSGGKMNWNRKIGRLQNFMGTELIMITKKTVNLSETQNVVSTGLGDLFEER